ncbi:MAG TPA: TonB-dependent receptor [Bacteroidota bacterium]
MKNIVWIAFHAFVLTSLAVGQTTTDGKIIGYVIDSETSEPIIGANVFLEGTMKGAATDIEGKFTIANVTPGTYTLIISVVSYTKQRIENLTVAEAQMVQLNIVLKPEVIQTQEVVVEAKAVLSYEGALLTQQKKAASISDGISAEQIKRSPDATSSDALKRITGVSIVDNKFVFVRGTPERYSNTMLNGAAVASTEPDKKAFAFDILPSHLIENSVITKSFTPDLPGDFAGGLVRLNTIDFPPALTVRVSAASSFNTQSTFKPFMTYHGGNSDYLGIDDGTRSLPGTFPNNLNGSFSADDLQQHARTLKNEWGARRRNAPLNNNFSISFGDGVTLLGSNFGFITALTYRSAFENAEIERNEFEASGEPRFKYRGDQSTYAVSWGALGNLSYKISDYHKFSIRNTYSRSADDEATEFTGIQYTDIGAEQKHTALRYVSRSIYTGQLTGEHFLPFLNGTQAEWKVFYSASERHEPDYRRLIYFREAGSNDPFNASLGFQANLKNGGRFYSDLNDAARGFAIDLHTPLSSAKVKFGTLVDRKDRDFSSRLIGMIVNGRGNGFTDNKLYTLPIDQIFAPENFRRNGFSIDEYQNGTNNYTAGQTVAASYAMVDFPFALWGSEFRLIAGARIEHSKQNVYSRDVSGSNNITVELTDTDVLPSVNVVYSLSQQANIRIAYSQTVNRPELRELAPFAYFDFNTQTSVRGNENLKRSLIRNYDVRFELFPRAGEILSASLFYKSFSNAIEQVVVTGSALGSERTFMNADAARNYGIEIEGRVGLGFLGEVVEDFSIRANYSRITSSVDVVATETTVEKRNRPLQGQSPYMLNLGLSYENPNVGTAVNVLFNRFGRRIVEVATAYEEDVIEQPRSVIDIVVSQPLWERYELKLSLKDLIAQEQLFLQGDKRARANQKGTSYSLGISFKL